MSKKAEAQFSGAVPEHYDRFLGPIFFEPYAIEVSSRFDPAGMHTVLEIGCGTGRVTRHLRTILPETSVLIASDISQDMMDVAKNKLKDHFGSRGAINRASTSREIDWRIIDAQDLPFEDESIDLVVSCFAYMFVEDKSKAFKEAFRVLKKGGTFIIATWDKLELNGASHALRKIVKEYIGDTLPKTYSLPFALSDPSEIRSYLEDAGFKNVSVEIVEKKSTSPSAKEAAYGLTRGGSLYQEIMDRNPAWVDAINADLEKELAEKFGDAPMEAPMRALISQGLKK